MNGGRASRPRLLVMPQIGQRLSGARHQARAALANDRAVFAAGQVLARLAAQEPPRTLVEAEFQVFSQWGEDGVIHHLVNRCAPDGPRTFVEIGVQDYSECNTRFLAMHRNWSGLAVDGGSRHEDFIRRSELDWRFGVRPVQAFVTAENVEELLPAGELGLLSIDVDGVDYWIAEAALRRTQPRILVLEYNALFGATATVTVPYRADFTWTDDPSWGTVYFGASLGALAHLAERHGYAFVGCESHGVNAFFVRGDVVGDLAVSLADGYRDSRAPVGRRLDGTADPFMAREQKLAMIADLPLYDVAADRIAPASELL